MTDNAVQLAEQDGQLDPMERFIWIDMETTGLDPKECVPLELGFIVTDIDLNEIDRMSWVIYEGKWDYLGLYKAPIVEEFVLDMHDKSGLWKDLPVHGLPLDEVQLQAANWLRDAGASKEDPMCGSSVQFDREWARDWFADVFGLFSYRNIDISTLKEVMRRFSPDIYKEFNDDWKANNISQHRVLPDLEDTIEEFKFYRKEFLFVPSDFA